MSLLESLEKIELAAQGNERLDAIRNNDSPELRELLEYALSPDITFGIKKIPEIPPTTVVANREWWFQLRDLLQKLRTRQLSGNAASKATCDLLTGFSALERKWAERVLKQDLRINVGAKDVNNALGTNAIYLFNVPLAVDYQKVKSKDLIGKWIIQPKLDGGRCVAVLPQNGGEVRLLSRTGKEWKNFESIRRQLQEANQRRKGPTVYLDGEVVSEVNGYIDFQCIQKTMMRKDSCEIGKLQYYVFDAATEEEWKIPTTPYVNRMEFAFEILKELGFDETISKLSENRIRFVFFRLEENPSADDLLRFSQNFVEVGYEGAMARRANVPVENKRSKNLLKIKSFLDEEALIVGLVEGTGKLSGSLGALKCRLLSADNIDFEIGSGFDDKTRMKLWSEKDTLIGEFVNFKYFEKTDAGIPRFPIFRSIRAASDVLAY